MSRKTRCELSSNASLIVVQTSTASQGSCNRGSAVVLRVRWRHFTNSRFFLVAVSRDCGLLHKLLRPEWRFSPSLLISHDVHNLSINLVFSTSKRLCIDKDEPATFQPDRRAEPSFELYKQSLTVWQLNIVQVVSRRALDSSDVLAVTKRGRWRERLFDRCL